MSNQQPQVFCHFHQGQSSTCTYIVSDPETKEAVIIDSVLDFSNQSGNLSTESADKVLEIVEENSLVVKYVLDTHVHADHITAASYLRSKLNVPYGIGHHITEVQKTFAEMFNWEDFPCDGSQFDLLLKEGDELTIGALTLKVYETPGHTPACCSYLIGDALFTGDTIFMPDFGTARCDFPKGSAATLYKSVHKLLELPESTRVFVGHDYGFGGREIEWESTIADEKTGNRHVKDGISEEEFIEMRETRDAQLNVPALLYFSLQMNINAGNPPQAESNGKIYLKLPLNVMF
eukprot:TRINITY_DN7455_c0_g1_i1.p1 TRINITY_DN7455_c0_g1~~TRINITY_DN7455_c0_g1_i1.p1  ORF type:complete len:291 (-),score=82.54 TRINITY_DN7455_c0_g1_i1:45-917(-)